MPETDALSAIRSAARSFEVGLPPTQRKRLGQFFTGLPLGVLLAELALNDRCRSVVDPMAGHGDLLEAAVLTALSRGIRLDRLDGIELDAATAAFCARRTTALRETGGIGEARVLSGSAFDPAKIGALSPDGYDLVITNPPYVRYQSQNGDGAGINDVRQGLSAIVQERVFGDERTLWLTLVKGYSGLADLSVPAWLLSALMTRPGGRLALVVPATWRSRDYADVVRYLLLRFFSLELIVADTQPGWFSDALVRTHLIVARRLPWKEAAPVLADRATWSSAYWLQIAPAAANGASLVGTAFSCPEPEAAFSAWTTTKQNPVIGIESRPFSLRDEWQTLQQRLKRKLWFQKAEDHRDRLPLFSRGDAVVAATIPEGLRDMLPTSPAPHCLESLDGAGIHIGQGLRTGCNRFFYVTLSGPEAGDTIAVEASDSFQKIQFRVPADALRPVLHRQADMQAFTHGHIPPTRALDLSNWILPEDEPIVVRAEEAYRKRGVVAPRVMPRELAAFVRMASRHAPDMNAPAHLIPDLSAVRTNVRLPAGSGDIPRFWYMLPAFQPRHLPTIFTPRINHGAPTVALNVQPAILIDANFSTVWPEETAWTNYALYALLKSSWCRAGMEAAGTPLGGGALKLEATHLRQLTVPPLVNSERQKLDALGRQLLAKMPAAQHALDLFVLTSVFPTVDEADLEKIALHLEGRLHTACTARQRITS